MAEVALLGALDFLLLGQEHNCRAGILKKVALASFCCELVLLVP
jgi:hypothetical protein